MVDYLAARADMVIRFQGGDNAGHTVVNDHGRFELHMIPCGIFYPHVLPARRGHSGQPGYRVRRDGHPPGRRHGHRQTVDRQARPPDLALPPPPGRRRRGPAQARGRASGEEMGTTRRGIGPVYADKHSYNGIRVGDLHHPDRLRQRLELLLPLKNRDLAFYGLQQITRR